MYICTKSHAQGDGGGSNNKGSKNKDDKELTGGEIAGIVIACVIGVPVICALLVLAVKKYKRECAFQSLHYLCHHHCHHQGVPCDLHAAGHPVISALCLSTLSNSFAAVIHWP